METIPTAEEYAHTQYLKRREEVGPGQFYPEPPSTKQINDMIEFAKLHVEAALKAASERAKIHSERIVTLGGTRYEDSVDEKSILNSYPLENIK